MSAPTGRIHEGRPLAVILTGERGCGKTTLCAEAAARNPRMTGLLCPEITDAAAGTGKRAVCIATGESWELTRTDRELDGPRAGRYSFFAAGLERAVACLRAALEKQSGSCVVDEIGPLEMDRGLGFAPILPLLSSAGNLIIVARPELAQRVAALVPRHQALFLTLTQGNRSEVLSVISARLGG